jgi:hypothetical protein
MAIRETLDMRSDRSVMKREANAGLLAVGTMAVIPAEALSQEAKILLATPKDAGNALMQVLGIWILSAWGAEWHHLASRLRQMGCRSRSRFAHAWSSTHSYQ